MYTIVLCIASSTTEGCIHKKNRRWFNKPCGYFIYYQILIGAGYSAFLKTTVFNHHSSFIKDVHCGCAIKIGDLAGYANCFSC
jgi:hypothetical protein